MIHRLIVATTVVALLGACASGPAVPTGAPPVSAIAQGEVDAIANLLNTGERKRAEKRLKAALKRDPMNASLLVLRQGISGNARADLGAESYEYVVKPGDTMPKLAERFLGNRLKSYQLARYNGIDTPIALATGSTLRIPGRPPRREAPARLAPRQAAPAAAPARPRTPSAKPAPIARPTARATTNPAAAQRARSAGLASLNQGRVVQAVGQLRRAAALDPGNAAIARDLARAERVAATVRARK